MAAFDQLIGKKIIAIRRDGTSFYPKDSPEVSVSHWYFEVEGGEVITYSIVPSDCGDGSISAYIEEGIVTGPDDDDEDDDKE